MDVERYLLTVINQKPPPLTLLHGVRLRGKARALVTDSTIEWSNHWMIGYANGHREGHGYANELK